MSFQFSKSKPSDSRNVQSASRSHGHVTRREEVKNADFHVYVDIICLFVVYWISVKHVASQGV